MPKVAHGEGVYVYDTDGNRYIDGSGGPTLFCIGHGNREVGDAIKSQIDRIAHGYRFIFTSDPLEELQAVIAEESGGGLTRMIFVSGGSEAVESCLKVALQYHSANGEPSRRRFISRQRSWHGNTLGALSVSGFQARRRRPDRGNQSARTSAQRFITHRSYCVTRAGFCGRSTETVRRRGSVRGCRYGKKNPERRYEPDRLHPWEHMPAGSARGNGATRGRKACSVKRENLAS